MDNLIPYFSSPVNVGLLRSAAVGLGHARFAQNANSPDAVDCATLVYRLLVLGCKYPHAFNPPSYRIASFGHDDSAMAMAKDYIESIEGCVAVSDGALMPGDILLFDHKRRPHFGVVLDTLNFIHAIKRSNVLVSRTDDGVWGKLITKRYRLMVAQ